MAKNIYYKNGGIIPLLEDDIAEAKRKLTGKILMVIGDSFFNNMNDQLAVICNQFGMVLDKRAITGSMIRIGGSNPMCSRVDTITQNYTDGYAIGGTTYHKDDVAVIAFMGGTNDGSPSDILGTGITDTATTTIYGAMHHILYTLLKEFTNAKVICLTQPSNYAYTTGVILGRETEEERARAATKLGFDSVEQVQGFDDIQFSIHYNGRTQNVVREVTQFYGCELIDMFREMPPISNPANKSAYWSSDTIHPSTAGYNLIGDAIEAKMLGLFGGT